MRAQRDFDFDESAKGTDRHGLESIATSIMCLAYAVGAVAIQLERANDIEQEKE
jgi:hypothetical protein